MLANRDDNDDDDYDDDDDSDDNDNQIEEKKKILLQIRSYPGFFKMSHFNFSLLFMVKFLVIIIVARIFESNHHPTYRHRGHPHHRRHHCRLRFFRVSGGTVSRRNREMTRSSQSLTAVPL